jgi:hypothetical protein
MADIAKAALRNRVLEHLNIVAAGATPATSDQTLVDEAIDAAWSRDRRFGTVPFPTSAIPDWAQKQMRAIVAFDVAPAYGITGQRFLELRAEAERAEFDLSRQVSGFKHKRTPRRLFF